MKRLLPVLIASMLLPAALGAQRSPADLPLRHGDRLLIRVWADTAFADSARVDGSGSVVLPVIGRVSIASLAAPAAVDSIRSAYGRVIRLSAVDVIALRRVVVSGEVQNPGVFFLEPQATLREAIAVAGGVTALGITSRIAVSRDSSRFEVKDWARREDAETIVRSGDVIWVQRESWVRRNALSLVSAAGVLLSVIMTLSR